MNEPMDLKEAYERIEWQIKHDVDNYDKDPTIAGIIDLERIKEAIDELQAYKNKEDKLRECPNRHIDFETAYQRDWILRDWILRDNAKLKLLLSIQEQYDYIDEVAFGDLRSNEEIENENAVLKEQAIEMLEDLFYFAEMESE